MTVYVNGNSNSDLTSDATKNEGSNAPAGTGFIFNADTKIEGAAKVVSGGPDNIQIWLQLQVI